ncbi:MAG TPA: hypothetical protein PK597_01380 [Oscillospiraceae bacterium]|nr:hypothetical protein [Oscillospiraceae bacterium]
MDRKSAAAQKEDAALSKILAIFGGACVVEILLLIVNRFYGDVGTFLPTYYALRAVRYLALAGVALGVLFALLRRKAKGFWLGVGVAVSCAAAFAAVLFIDWMYPYGAQYLCVVVPVAALLGIVYYIYQLEFFVCAAMEAVSLAALWAVRRSAAPLANARILAVAVVAALLIAAAVGFSLLLKSRGGRLTRKKSAPVIFPARTDYRLIPVSGALGLAALALGLFAGPAVAMYAMICLAAYLFVLAVYFTVRLM